MTSLRQLLRSSTWFLFFMLLGMSLFWESCDNNTKKQVNKLLTISGDTLPDTVAAKGVGIEDNFRSAKGDLSNDFLFDGKSGKTKATYFKLNANQTKLFFAELDKTMNSSVLEDSVRIRVHMGLFDEEGTQIHGRPNLTLLMSVSTKTNDPAPSDLGFPLRSFQKLPIIEFPRITSKIAKSLTETWQNIANKDINKQLYLEGNSSNPRGRIEYYTFNTKDTRDIYDYQKRNPKCRFYLYLGLLNQSEHVPLRVIIRLTPNPSFQPQAEYLEGDGEEEEDYEFSSPCPNICG